jgi:LmbE family N-acetylglucosaminyl deacetylase
MRWIYISPHLDDAVLSCGGLIREQTSSKTIVEIWTVCAGDPPEGELSHFAQQLHEEWGTGSETPARRRLEDIAACQRLGSRYRHLSFLDCIYRQSPDGTWLYPDGESIQATLAPQDDATIKTLQTFLATTLKPDDILVCPLSVGNHVDHQLVRLACEKLKRPILYYADVPYIFDQPEQLLEFSISLLLQTYPFSQHSLESWQEAIQIYTSQFDSLFDTLDSMRDLITSYYGINHGINFWKSI